jgi:RND family efflux transporter MFP subunit
VVETLLVDIGSTVKAGELLATLESTDQALTLQKAELTLAAATRAVDRVHELAKSKLIAPADVEQGETDFRQAEIARDQAKRAMALTRVTAPFAGVVAARSAVRAGRLVAAGDSLLRVTALTPLRASIHIPDAQSRGLRVGSAATVWSAGGSARASVIRAAPSIDAASGTRELILEITGATALRPGTSVTVHVGGERRTVIAIPAAAVSDSGYVVVWQDGRTTLRAVTLGPKLPDGRVEVTSGLTAGERLVPARS